MYLSKGVRVPSNDAGLFCVSHRGTTFPMGMQMSLWTERVADFKRLDFMVFPRLIALAEAAWTPEKAKECSMFMQRLPYFLKYLDSMDIYYFNPLNPTEREEPGAPEKEDVLQNG